jgi:hypothetical protein
MVIHDKGPTKPVEIILPPKNTRGTTQGELGHAHQARRLSEAGGQPSHEIGCRNRGAIRYQ